MICLIPCRLPSTFSGTFSFVCNIIFFCAGQIQVKVTKLVHVGIDLLRKGQMNISEKKIPDTIPKASGGSGRNINL